MTFRERVIHGPTTTDHIVQLFDSPESFTDAVSEFLIEGYRAGDSLLLAITPQHWTLINAALERNDCPTAPAMASGQLTVLDAADTMHQFTRDGRPDASLFAEVIGETVRRLNCRGVPLRIYGEMVDVLAGEGDFKGAQDLEELWNALGEREPFTLFCGYTTIHFGDPRTGASLQQICRTHTHVRMDPRDILGSFLLQANPQRAATAEGR